MADASKPSSCTAECGRKRRVLSSSDGNLRVGSQDATGAQRCAVLQPSVVGGSKSDEFAILSLLLRAATPGSHGRTGMTLPVCDVACAEFAQVV